MAIRGELIETVTGAPPDGWEHGEVIISLRNPNDRAVVEAWRLGSFAVHAVVGGGWRLTHAPSGLRIWSFSTTREAIELAERIEAMTDWTAIKKELPMGSKLYPKVRKVIDEIVERESAQPTAYRE
jgi:hypothetical protein